jgi:hypothetical protein
VRDCTNVKKKGLAIREDDKARERMCDGTAGVRTHSRDDVNESIDRDDILREKQDEKWHRIGRALELNDT